MTSLESRIALTKALLDQELDQLDQQRAFVLQLQNRLVRLISQQLHHSTTQPCSYDRDFYPGICLPVDRPGLFRQKPCKVAAPPDQNLRLGVLERYYDQYEEEQLSEMSEDQKQRLWDQIPYQTLCYLIDLVQGKERAPDPPPHPSSPTTVNRRRPPPCEDYPPSEASSATGNTDQMGQTPRQTCSVDWNQQPTYHPMTTTTTRPSGQTPSLLVITTTTQPPPTTDDQQGGDQDWSEEMIDF